MKGNLTRQQAINAKCRDYCYDKLAGGTWKQQTERCPSTTTCALWPYRPISDAVADTPTSSAVGMSDATGEGDGVDEYPSGDPPPENSFTGENWAVR
jgi:hypothetical protein